MHPGPSTPHLLRALGAGCVLVWAAAACSSSASSEATPGAGDDGGSSGAQGDSGGKGGGDAASGGDGATGPGDGAVAADSRASDGSSGGGSDAGHEDAAPPPAPACKTGDRTETSGPVGSTGVAVAVCSVCGASYVVASNGTASAAKVTLDNGSNTVTLDVPAGKSATSANLADKSDGTVAVCATGASHACLPKDPQNQRYCDPYRGLTGLRTERIDQGVDYGGAGPIYAMGPGTIDLYRNRNDTGWPGGTFMSYKVTAGPAAGKEIYLAENIDLDPSLTSGSAIYNGTVLGTLVDASPDSESGWGVPGAGYTAEHGCYTEGCMTPLGVNFNALLVCLKTPSGTTGTGGCCPQPTGYPADAAWCSLLSAWQ